MLIETPAEASTAVSSFPSAEVRRRLTDAIQAAAADEAILQGSWDPRLDSLSMVSVVITLEELFNFPLPPERLVRRGGYANVEEGIGDMSRRLEGLWNERQGPEVRP